MALVDSAGAGLAAAARGATLLQLRAPGGSARELEADAVRLMNESTVPVLISSRADLALACGAAGVHLPEADLPVRAARRLLGPDLLVGKSVHSLAAAREAAADGADYLVFGPVFGTASHPGRPSVGLETLREIAAAVAIPVLGIGGVTPERAAALREAGAAGYAAISAFRA